MKCLFEDCSVRELLLVKCEFCEGMFCLRYVGSTGKKMELSKYSFSIRQDWRLPFHIYRHRHQQDHLCPKQETLNSSAAKDEKLQGTNCWQAVRAHEENIILKWITRTMGEISGCNQCNSLGIPAWSHAFDDSCSWFFFSLFSSTHYEKRKNRFVYNQFWSLLHRQIHYSAILSNRNSILGIDTFYLNYR